MKILVTGSGKSGSWQIRGEQLGRAIDAAVVPNATDLHGFDVVIAVKRVPPDLVARARRLEVPLVWDVVDAWPQPVGNDWAREHCIAWLRQRVEETRPAAIVAATRSMKDDCAQFGLPVLALPHHVRPGLERNPIRASVSVVGYEGGENYLGKWRAPIETECARRGWRFEVNPRSLADLDVLVAVREATGYAPRSWKSNVKLANAQGSGTPCVLNLEAGYLETASAAELWADDAAGLSLAFDALESRDARLTASDRLFAVAPGLDAISKVYRQWLEKTFSTAPSC